jgi:colanic acid biosynthesis glycosyl transferase WcaI
MRILVNDYAGHPFELQLSRELARRGHTVLHTYFAAMQTPKGKVDDSSEDRLSIVGITSETPFSSHCVRSRRAADQQYGRTLCRQLIEFQPDVVISANTPLDAQRLLLHETKRQGAKFIFWMQDLLSSAIEFVLRKKGVPFSSLAGKWYAHLEKRLLRESDAIVCIAPEFREVLRRWGIDSENVFVIENWAPLDEISPLPRNTAFSQEHNLDETFCFMYSGTLGMKHKPELLLELAKNFAGRPDVKTVVIAQGAGADWLRANANQVPATSLLILPFQPYERHAEILASSDVLITLLDDECGACSVPSKLLAYLCASRPILLAAPAENLASKIVHRTDAGVAARANTADFLKGARRMLDNREQLSAYSANGRRYAEKKFCIDLIGDNFLNVVTYAMFARKMKELASRRAPGTGIPLQLLRNK